MKNQSLLSIIGLVCISLAALPTAHAEESFSMTVPKREGASSSPAASMPSAPVPSVEEKAIPSGETTPDPSPPETNTGLVVPRITGSVDKELQATGMVVAHLEFGAGQARIMPEHLPWIDEIAAALVAHPDWKLSIEGHTDRMGRPDWNKRLSLLRAEAVRDALLARGIAPERLRCIGWGAERPVDTASTVEAYARNRRVELHLK